MEITFDTVKELRDKGLSWREIGLYFAKDSDEEPYLLQERARKRWRRNVSKTKLAKGSESSTVTTPLPSVVPVKEEDLESEESLLKAHGYDPERWVIVDSSCKINTNSVNTRVKVVPRQVPKLDEEVFAHMLQTFMQRRPTPRDHVYEDNLSDITVVVPLYDVHYGRRFDGRDHEDTAVAVITAIEDIASKLEKKPPREIILPIGQDFCNTDNPQGTTTKGTAQENSLAWHEILSGALALAVTVTDRLAQIAPVRVIYSKGNHDEVMSFGIVKALAERYRYSAHVRVTSDAHPRQYIELENTLLGFTHGNTESDLAHVMQVEAREAWGHTTHHYWLTGHLHSLSVMEKSGVTVIRAPALTFSDTWTTSKGYASRRALMCAGFSSIGLEEVYFASAG